MNSYPVELLTQLAPVMFVAGLDAPEQVPQTVPPTPTSPHDPASPPPSRPQPQDPFTALILRLRDALVSQRKPSIWQPEKPKIFQVVMVDKQVRFPPRKLLPPEDPGYSAAHSPLSPLTPSSPLHPDGLIAPIWIRKHTTLVPSVFVLFTRLYELPPHSSRSPLDLPDPDRDREREQEERGRDTELSAEIALRKKSTNERGIKLTVVLLASRRILDSRAALFVLSPVSQAELGEFIQSLQQALFDPAIEYYTTHSKRVRRKRNRHSQVVSTYQTPISPLGNPTVARPLRPEGWTVRYEYKMACFAEFRGEDEVALKHYQDAYETLVIMFGSTIILPPRTKRWAEAKVLVDCINIKITKLYLYNNEHALALSHHNTHMRKFGDFSRGWGIGEETYEYWSWMARQHRVLAELLEQGTHSTLVLPIHKPVVPISHSSSTTATTTTASRVASPGMELDAIKSLGINPNHALQHPGFYYYMAARCTESRKEKFLVALEDEEPSSQSPGFANEKKVDHSVIILELYTKSYEMFKKYASLANPQNQQGQGRLPLFIAYRIAQSYYDSGKFDMAIRFFERIAKTYRREHWGSLLRPLLSTWYRCAQQLGDVELGVRLLIEMLGYDSNAMNDPESLQEDLIAVLKSTMPSSEEAIVIDHLESQPLFVTNLVFWKAEVQVGEQAAFQLSLTAPKGTPISSLPFASLEIYLANDKPPITITHVDGGHSSPIQKVELGHINSESNGVSVESTLRWNPGDTLILTGTISSGVPTTLSVSTMDLQRWSEADSQSGIKLSSLKLTLIEGAWKVEIPLESCQSRLEPKGSAPRWLCSVDPPRFTPVKRENYSSVNVRHRPHVVAVSLKHSAPAYLNETYPITVEVTNWDDKELDVIMDVLLLPTELDFAVNTISVDGEQSSGLIKGVSFGPLAPGISAVKILHIVSTGATGDRTLDISVQSRTPTAIHQDSETSPQPELLDITETLQTVVIPTVEPFSMTCDVTYRRAAESRRGVADLKTFKSDFWDDSDGGEAIVRTVLQCNGPWGLQIDKFALKRQNEGQAKVLDSSIGGHGDVYSSGNYFFPVTDRFFLADDSAEYLPGDEFGDVCRISIAPPQDTELQLAPIPCPGEYEVTWRRVLPNGEYGIQVTTTFTPPPLQPPVDGLIALLDIPPQAKLHQPITLTLTIRNRQISRSENITVQLEPDPTDGFIVTGLRNGRVPLLLPGAEERLVWKLIPVECGYVKPPKIRVLDRRKAIASAQGLAGPDSEVETEGVPVKIVDLRIEQKLAAPKDVGEDANQEVLSIDESNIANVLVLP
ncbi:glutathione transferase omega-1 [Moniliophthora roreri]|nr:glutathione transferase omega-1 [Moniliophthora roreri]